MTDRAALRDAILKALPVDWDDRTTVVEVVPDDGRGHPVTVWGHPERLADAILAAILPVLDEGWIDEWAVRTRGTEAVHCLTRNEADARAIWDQRRRDFELVRRRISDWRVA
jgi:hypothetical protein